MDRRMVVPTITKIIAGVRLMIWTLTPSACVGYTPWARRRSYDTNLETRTAEREREGL
jgi:hypothetical protein